MDISMHKSVSDSLILMEEGFIKSESCAVVPAHLRICESCHASRKLENICFILCLQMQAPSSVPHSRALY